MKIKGIIFDFDGLILDTESVEVNIWETIFQQYGLVFPLDRYLQYIGHTTDNQFVLEFMAEKGLSSEQIKAADEIHQRLLNSPGIFHEPREGVRDFIQSAKNHAFKLGIASNSSHDWVYNHLRHLKLMHYFDTIGTRDEVSHSKPHPEIYHFVLKKLALQPEEVIAFEDSPNGIQAAKNANIYCIAVPNPITAKMEIKHADMIFHSFAEINLQEIKNNIKNNQY